MSSAVDEVARNAASASESSSESGRIARQGSERITQTLSSINQLAADVDSTSSNFGQLAGKIRGLKGQDLEEGVSTRLVVYAASLIQQGMGVDRAIEAAMIEPLTDDADTKRGLRDLSAAVFG